MSDDEDFDRIEKEAHRLFGDVELHDRECEVGFREGEPRFAIERFQGFTPPHVLGEGHTWEEALDDAKRSRG